MDKERRDYIHRDVKRTEGMELPFDITKPKKDVPRDIVWNCKSCGKVLLVSRHTYLVVCSACNTINKKDD